MMQEFWKEAQDDTQENRMPENSMNEQRLADQTTQQEQGWLWMSLALDGLLDEHEEAEFNRLLRVDSSLSLEWRRWQQIHKQFTRVTHVEPPVDFVAQFEQRLEQQVLQNVQRANLAVVIAALLLWGGMLAGAITFGLYAYNNQAVWVSQLIHSITISAASFSQWFRSLQVAIDSSTSSPQTLGLLVGYCCAGVAILFWWVQWLRNHTQMTGA